MSSSNPSPPKQSWIQTPTILSAPLSRAAGCNVYLKLENLQPSGSFKSRGIGNLMVEAIRASPSPAADSVHFFCSSGGNAGLACATTAASLGCPATIVVPELISPLMVAKLRALDGAASPVSVVQTGANWAAADSHMRETLIADHKGRAIYVPPFDHPHIWTGASTLVDELSEQMAALGSTPIDAVVCNVGGGGLLNGIVEGFERRGGPMPRVVAMETVGADSLAVSVKAGELVTLEAITSIATSLGASRVSQRTWDIARRYARGDDGTLVCATVSDAEAVDGCVRFLGDTRLLVEPACGATLMPAYNGDLRRYLGRGLSDEEWAKKNVVMVVCGGSNINLEYLQSYREKFGV